MARAQTRQVVVGLVAVMLTVGLIGASALTASEASPPTCTPLHPIQSEMLPFVNDMLTDAFHAYFENAFPHDGLRSLRPDEWYEELGGYGVTLIDSLDMLAIMGRHDMFRRIAKWLELNVNFDRNVTVSAFETNIRTVGGLLSAHLLYEEGIVPVVPEEHDYKGGLLDLAVNMGTRLLGTYKSAIGLLYNSVNLVDGVADGETDVVCNAAAGTFSVEMLLLSRLTGDTRFETAGRWAQQIVHDLRFEESSLMGDHIRGLTGGWVGFTSSVGTSIDSTIEYTLKTHVLTGGTDEWARFEVQRRAAHKFLGRNGFYFHSPGSSPTRWVYTVHESLASFYPGLLLLGGQRREAATLAWSTQTVWRRYGALAEMTEMRGGQPSHNSESYPLRPEHIESVYHLYRATRDPAYLQMGREAALALHLRTRTAFGFSGLRDVSKVDSRHGLIGDMESFLLAETLKYLYLLFDECNPLHTADSRAASADLNSSTVGWVFTTEAHPIPNSPEWWEESAPWHRANALNGAQTAEPTASTGAGRLTAQQRQSHRPPYGALFPVIHGNNTVTAFAALDAVAVEDTKQRVALVHAIVSDFVEHPDRTRLPRAGAKAIWHGMEDRSRPFTESSREARERHITGLRRQVASELLAGGVRGGYTGAGGLNDVEDSCAGALQWQLGLDWHIKSTASEMPTQADLLIEEEARIPYEYFCSNHLFKDTDYLTQSLNYL